MEENKILRHIDQNDQPEPMEVDAVKTATDPLEKKVEKLTELVNVLLVQHKDEIQQRNVQPQQAQQYQQKPAAQYTSRPPQNYRNNGHSSNAPRRDAPSTPKYRYTEDGRPICHFCDIPGHIRRHCRKAKRQQEN